MAVGNGRGADCVVDFRLPLGGFGAAKDCGSSRGSSATVDFLCMISLSVGCGGSSFVAGMFPIHVISSRFITSMIGSFILTPAVEDPITSVRSGLIRLCVSGTSTAPGSDRPFAFGNMGVGRLELDCVTGPTVIEFTRSIGNAGMGYSLPRCVRMSVIGRTIRLCRVTGDKDLTTTRRTRRGRRERRMTGGCHRSNGRERWWWFGEVAV